MITILYVDDEPDLLEIAKIFLEQSGDFRVTTSVSAKEALSSPEILSHDAIVSDYQMPGMDGIAFLKAVREQSGDMPFILFTGRGREEVVINAINNGADFYLQKGGDPRTQFAELMHKVRQAVRRKDAERSLRDSERRLSDIIDFLPDATFAIDRSGKVIAWNRAIEEMTGVPATDMLDRGDYAYAVPFYGSPRPILIDLIDKPDDTFEQSYSNIFRTGTSLTAETDLPHPKGNRISVLAKVCHLYNQAGEITGAIESIRDITERKFLETDLERKHWELQASYEHLAAAEEELRGQFEELVRSEQQVRTNEERLAMAQEIGHTGSWEYNLVTNEIWGSSEGLHIFGFHQGAGEFPIEDIEACIPERERVHQALVDLVTKGQEYNLEYAINPADGSAPRVIHSVARLVKDTGGGTLRVVGVIHDITERKRAEAERAFTSTILSTQQETSPDAILTVDGDGKILHFNRRFVDLWGVPEDLIAARDHEPVLHFVLEQLAEPEAFISRVNYLTEHKDERSNEELRFRDGRVLERFSAPMLGETGKYYGRVWYFRDVTRRKRTEEDLRESEERFHSLFTHMIEGVALHEIHYNGQGIAEDYRIIDTNPAFDKHLGISRDTVIGKTSREAYGVNDPPYLDIYARVVRTGEPAVFETYFPPLDRIFSISAYRPTAGHFATIFEDITERRRTERALRESAEFLNSVIEQSPAPMWISDDTGMLIRINKACRDLLGITDADVVGKYNIFQDTIVEEQGFMPLVTKVFAAGEPVNFPLVYDSAKLAGLHLSHTVKRTLSVSIFPIRDADGRVTNAIIQHNDITSWKEAEEALRECRKNRTRMTGRSE